MPFYTYQYLVQQTHTVNKIQWAVMAVIFIALLIMGYFWVRRRLDYRLKEVGVLLIILLLLLGGVQLNTYYNEEASDNQYAQLLATIQAAAKSLDVDPDVIKINRTDLNVDPVIMAEEQFYILHMSDDKLSYLLEKIDVGNRSEIQITDVEGSGE
ncbi:hypothetical protein RU97_GL001654 [Enterococcus canis]|uniref:DUF3290 domain-containing protein n=1 Tax=Enterococcus canis TaxID=214095 RepID=A0A1L8RGZ3_9ENTE|nr:DUF3290 family protein [Enterococcus canis]OJG19036.1 hypothetical protein RU97_GL001654 [Enterococcus canis]